jgi:hypothetical protein
MLDDALIGASRPREEDVQQDARGIGSYRLAALAPRGHAIGDRPQQQLGVAQQRNERSGSAIGRNVRPAADGHWQTDAVA